MTISDADRLLDMPREELAAKIWHEVAAIDRVAERSAALADRARAARDVRRDAGRKRKAPRRGHTWRNLVLAGDWTATGLPATIEGAMRSGHRAAELIEARRTWTRAA